MTPEILSQPSIENIVSLIKNYKNTYLELLDEGEHYTNGDELERANIMGHAERLYDVIEDLEELIKPYA